MITYLHLTPNRVVPCQYEFSFLGKDLVDFVSAGSAGVCGDNAAGSDARGVDNHSG